MTTKQIGWALLLIVCCTGCNRQPQAASEKDKSAFRVLAKHLSDSWDTKRQKESDGPKNLAQCLALGNSVIIELDALQIDDPQLRKVRDELRIGIQELLDAVTKLDKLPRPRGRDDMIMANIVCAFGWRWDIAAEFANDAQKRLDAVDAELLRLKGAEQRMCGAKLLLAQCKGYAGQGKLDSSGILVDIDESFILEPNDWIILTNTTGRPLTNVLITIRLTGKKGDTADNVHFAEKWLTGERRYARYTGGIKIGDGFVGRQTVVLIQSVKISVAADKGCTGDFVYQYAGAEKSKDVLREFDVIRNGVKWNLRDGVLGGKVFVLENQTGHVLPIVSVSTSAGTRNYGDLAHGDSFDVGKLQIDRNLERGDRVSVLISGHEMFSLVVGPSR